MVTKEIKNKNNLLEFFKVSILIFLAVKSLEPRNMFSFTGDQFWQMTQGSTNTLELGSVLESGSVLEAGDPQLGPILTTMGDMYVSISDLSIENEIYMRGMNLSDGPLWGQFSGRVVCIDKNYSLGTCDGRIVDGLCDCN